MLCVCGADCAECERFNKECAGCAAISGRVWWAAFIGKEVCPVYKCAQDAGKTHCGECGEIPCALWYSLKDPSMTDAQHEQSIHERAARLKMQKN